jgi:hypothetical protein
VIRATTNAAREETATPPKPRTGSKPPSGGPRPSKLTGTPEAKLRACVVLEVLGGQRTPTDASAALGLTVQRYYLLETRALQGLLAALEAKPRPGRRPSTEGELARLRAERDRLERELRRAQALVRATQRAIGLAPAKEPPKSKEKGKRKKKRPTVRARRLAAALRVESAGPGNPVATPATAGSAP